MQNDSLFNVYICNYCNKNCKKIEKKTVKGQKEPMFRPPLGTNGMEKYHNSINNYYVTIYG